MGELVNSKPVGEVTGKFKTGEWNGIFKPVGEVTGKIKTGGQTVVWFTIVY